MKSGDIVKINNKAASHYKRAGSPLIKIDLIESRKIEMTLFAKFGNKIFGFIILLYIFLIFSFKKLKNE